MSLGVNFDELNRDYYYARASKVPTGGATGNYNANATNPVNAGSIVADDSIFSQVGSGNTCTDGKDDGKIKWYVALGNIAQGVARTIPNMIKGAFTDSEGKFSLLKTATTIGTAALCIAFPAAGLFACGVGAVTSGIKIVQQASTALSATTDAEAKAAWENVGSGGLTLALSIAGAKSSFKAMEKQLGTSASFGKEGSFLESLKQHPLQTVKNLGKDMWNSSKKSVSSIWNGLKNFFSNSKTKMEAKEYNKLIQEKETLEAKKIDEGLNPNEQTRLDELTNKTNGTSEAVRENAAKLQQQSSAKATAKSTLAEAEEALAKAKKALDNASNASDAEKLAAQAEFGRAQMQYNAALADYKAMTTMGKVQNAVSNCTQNTRTAFELLKQGDAEGAIAAIKKMSLGNLDLIRMGLSDDAKYILADIQNGKNFQYISDTYGWEAVTQVIKAFSGIQALDMTV